MSDLFATAALSVCEINEIAHNLLDEQLSGLWIAGEVSNLTQSANGHRYFVLKDAQAQLRCVLFKHQAARLPVPLRDGAHIEIQGKLGIYAARGDFQITVHDVRQVGVGYLYRQFEFLKQRLQNEGLFDENHKKRLPEYPQTIGIISSLAAAALRDVLTTLQRRVPHLAVILYPTPVQGADSAQQIAQAIDLANKRAETDVLIVCRGGGSLEDLWSFNEEIVVRAVSGSQIPIISGVGHETDWTLCDLAADIRAPTPTAAAELVSRSRDELAQILHKYSQNLQYGLKMRHRAAKNRVDLLAQKLQHPRQKFTQQKHDLHRIQAAFFQAAETIIQEKNQQLQQSAILLEAVSPLKTLQRGFAVVQNKKAQIVRHADDVQTGEKLTVRFAQSQIRVHVLDKQQMDLFD